MSPAQTKRILLLVPADDYRKVVRLGLSMASNWELQSASSVRQGLAIAAEQALDAIVIDGDLDEDIIRTLLANPAVQSLPVIAMVEGRTGDWCCAQTPNVAAVLSKLVNPLSLPMAIAAALQWPSPRQSNSQS